jgi:hypothetical protein
MRFQGSLRSSGRPLSLGGMNLFHFDYQLSANGSGGASFCSLLQLFARFTEQ